MSSNSKFVEKINKKMKSTHCTIYYHYYHNVTL